ncbi:MAG: ABC transporter permease [Kofleriaceae bacterium]
MGSLWLDLRYALRTMAKSPGLTAVLAITLALGIGASTTIFSVVHSVVLRPLPYERPDGLLRIYTNFTGKHPISQFPLSAAEYHDLATSCDACETTAAWGDGTAMLTGGDRPVHVRATWASHSLLPALGVAPQLGRFFDASEDRPGDPTVVLISHGLWQRAYGGDRTVVGRKILLDAMPVTIIGVMPPGFGFPEQAEAWAPLCQDWANAARGSHWMNALVRLAPGHTLAQLRDELRALDQRWLEHTGDGYHSREPVTDVPFHPLSVTSFQSDFVGPVSTTLWLLQAAVLFVLMIAIVNVANLLLARSETRGREVAIRHALGASRGRLIRQFLTESALLGVLGGGLGILVAAWAVDGVTALIPSSVPRAGEIELDGAAVAFAVACALGASLLFGLAPIVHARRTDLHGALKDGSQRLTGNKARLRVRRTLVILEISLAVVLVIGCSVMVRCFTRMQRVELGFRPDHVIAFGIELPDKSYPGLTGDALWYRLEERLRALPGVRSATLLRGLPPHRAGNPNLFEIEGRTPSPSDPTWIVDHWQVMGTEALETLGARLVRGRTIQRSDTAEAPMVVLINEAFAAKFFPGEDPIGRRLRISPRPADGEPQEQTIVGIVADIRQQGLDKPPGTEVFIPLWQYPRATHDTTSVRTMRAVIRTEGEPAALLPAAQRVVADLDPTLPLFQVQTLDERMWRAGSGPRFLTLLLTAFAVIALVLAAVGIYGVMSHTVAQRTHEIGLRVALGAPPALVRAMVLRQSAVLVAIGAAVGLAVALALELALGPSLHRMLYGERLTQPLLLGAVIAVIAATALIATWLPVRRATRIQPTVALRSE